MEGAAPDGAAPSFFVSVVYVLDKRERGFLKLRHDFIVNILEMNISCFESVFTLYSL